MIGLPFPEWAFPYRAVGGRAHSYDALIRQIDIGKLRIMEMDWEETEHSGNGQRKMHRGNVKLR